MENYDEIANVKLKKILREKEKHIKKLENELENTKKELESERKALFKKAKEFKTLIDITDREKTYKK